MSGSSREALRNVREWSVALQNVREWSGDPPGYLGVVGRPSRMFGRPSRMSGSCREAIPDVRKMSGGPPG